MANAAMGLLIEQAWNLVALPTGVPSPLVWSPSVPVSATSPPSITAQLTPGTPNVVRDSSITAP
jgi:hypothetical protein